MVLGSSSPNLGVGSDFSRPTDGLTGRRASRFTPVALYIFNRLDPTLPTFIVVNLNERQFEFFGSVKIWPEKQPSQFPNESWFCF
jgi:hypothetical protein